MVLGFMMCHWLWCMMATSTLFTHRTSVLGSGSMNLEQYLQGEEADAVYGPV